MLLVDEVIEKGVEIVKVGCNSNMIKGNKDVMFC